MNRSSIKRRRRSKRKSIKRGGAGEEHHKKEVENFFKGISSPLVRTTVKVEVPAGLGSGDTLTLEVKGGVSVEIPAGVSAGDEFEVEITEKLEVTDRIGETIGRFLKEKNKDYPNFCALIYRICCSIFGIIEDLDKNNMKTYHYSWWLWPLSFGELPNRSEEEHTGEHNEVWYTPSFLKGSEFDVFKSTSKGGGLPIEGGAERILSAVRSFFEHDASAQNSSSSSHGLVKQNKVNQFMGSTNVGKVTAQQELEAAGGDLEQALKEYNQALSYAAAAKDHPKKSGNFIISGFNQETYKIFRDRFPELYQQWLGAHQLLFKNMNVVSLEDKYPQVDDERVVRFNVSTLPNFPDLVENPYTEDFVEKMRELRKQRKPKTPAAAPSPAPQLPLGWTKFEHEGVVWYYPTKSGPKAENLQHEFPGTPRQRVPRIMTAEVDRDVAGVGVVNDLGAQGDNMGNQCYMISVLQCLSSLPYFRTLASNLEEQVADSLSALEADPESLDADGFRNLTLSECLLRFTKEKYKRNKPFTIRVPKPRGMHHGIWPHTSREEFTTGERTLVGIIKEKVGKISSVAHLDAVLRYDSQEDAPDFMKFLINGLEREGQISLVPFTVFNKKGGICLNCIKEGRSEHMNYTGGRPIILWPLMIDPEQVPGVSSVQEALTAFYKEDTDAGPWHCSRCNYDTKKIDKQILTVPTVDEIEMGMMAEAREGHHEAGRRRLAEVEKRGAVDEQMYPEYLMLQLNRFRGEVDETAPDGLVARRIGERIFMNEYIYLYPYSEGGRKVQYKLVCICFHSGRYGGGHYIAKCLQQSDGQWYEYNDARVHRCDSPVNTSDRNCYLLFYQKYGDGADTGLDELQEKSEALKNTITTDPGVRERLKADRNTDRYGVLTFEEALPRIMGELQAAPEPGTGPKGKEATMRTFRLLVNSEDPSLLSQPLKAIVEANTLDQLNVAVQQNLNLSVAVRVLIFDHDFEVWVVPNNLEEVLEKAKVMIKRK